jgi:AraC-like DNA-binding protein
MSKMKDLNVALIEASTELDLINVAKEFNISHEYVKKLFYQSVKD